MTEWLGSAEWQAKGWRTGWIASLMLHALLLAAVANVMPKLTLAPQQEPFRWDVTLVEATQDDPTSEITTPMPVVPHPQPTKASEVSPMPVQQEVVTEQVTPVVERESKTMIETAPPVQQVVQVETRTIQQKIEQDQPEVKEMAVSETKQEVQPLIHAEPVMPAMPVMVETAAAYQSAPQTEPTQAVVAQVASSISEASPVSATQAVADMPVERASTEGSTNAISTKADSDVPTAHAVPQPVETGHATPVAQETPQLIAKAAPQPSLPRKVDHSWLAELLGRRIAELKRYPTIAKLNGWEGKVIVRAVIREDGHLGELSVSKSSGHEALDKAALETVRLACPLKLLHQLASPTVVVHIPIKYTLGG